MSDCHGIPLTIFHCALVFFSVVVPSRDFHWLTRARRQRVVPPSSTEPKWRIAKRCVCYVLNVKVFRFFRRLCLMPFCLLLLLCCLYNIWGIREIDWRFFLSCHWDISYATFNKTFSYARTTMKTSTENEKAPSAPIKLC